MHPLLSREEIHALLNESGEPPGEPPCQLIIEPGQQCIVLQGLFDLRQGAVIELNPSLDRPYEIRSKGRLVAYGALVVLDGKLVLQITHLIDCHDDGIVE